MIADRGVLLLAVGVLLLAVGACAFRSEDEARLLPSPTVSFPPASPGSLGPGRLEERSFRSDALARTMAFTVYLPPGYDETLSLRYPTLYLLHGGSGLRSEWIDYGVVAAADRSMRARTIARFLIVLPQGDQEYWVDHVVDASVGANGERWGTYVARDVVREIDARYRTVPNADGRAIGGLSMGGHGAMQLAMSFPAVWSVVGAHGPSLRPYGDAPTYLGRGAEFAARDPLLLIEAKPEVARGHSWWIDSGDVDPWRAQALAISQRLTSLGIAHEWRSYMGDHSLAYWSAHVDDYLGYYAVALCRRSRCPGS